MAVAARVRDATLVLGSPLHFSYLGRYERERESLGADCSPKPLEATQVKLDPSMKLKSTNWIRSSCYMLLLS